MPANKPSTTAQMVRFDLNHLPPLTEAQKARLEALAKLPDAQIDDSDAPPFPDAVWTKPVGFSARNKQQISLRIDADVLDWFKGTGKRYQTHINAVLRSYVDARAANVGNG